MSDLFPCDFCIFGDSRTTDANISYQLVLENPYDNLLRKVMTDYLSGSPAADALSEFIGLQVATFDGMKVGATAAKRTWAKLFKENKKEWFGKINDDGCNHTQYVVELYSDTIKYVHRHVGDCVNYARVSRGLVNEIWVTEHKFLTSAWRLFARHPITRVVLTDKRATKCNYMSTNTIPYYKLSVPGRKSASVNLNTASDVQDTLTDIQSRIDRRLFDFVAGDSRTFSFIDGSGPSITSVAYFNSECDVADAISDACVKFGRKAVGLPELPPGRYYANKLCAIPINLSQFI